MESRDFTFKETIEILKKVNEGWFKESNFKINSYDIITEQFFPDKNNWEEIGMFTLPFVNAPRSVEVANHECLHYYEKNDREYLRIGNYRYVVNDAIRNIIKDF